ncbi:MAG: nucleotidyltransferase domain-containing protein [Candidatus Binatia bacterium]
MTTLEDKLNRYKEPSSPTEKEKQDRAERMVRDGVKAWSGFDGVSLRYLPKGSYKNNTNVKADSDVDIAVIREGLYYYNTDLLKPEDVASIGTGPPSSLSLKGMALRVELEKALCDKFGSACDTSGNTAITVSENSGRVSADVVPSFPYRLYYYDSLGPVTYVEGTKTFRKDGSQVVNYPEQQYSNGVTKNNATSRRYKYLVRILKRLENDLVTAGEIGELPSYFMECLVYRVPNKHFGSTSATPLTDDLKAVLAYIFGSMDDGSAVDWYEPNEIKKLFGAGQPWAMQNAHNLTLQIAAHLGFGS